MAMSAKEEGYQPTYREQDVDDTLDNHDTRLSRLEKAAFIGAGYIARDVAPNGIIDTVITLL